MNVVAIIQARMRSTRLPDKVLAEIGGRPMLSRVCDRVRLASTVDHLVVATSDEPDDRAIEKQCERLHVACFRGSQQDVLDRYYQAARAPSPGNTSSRIGSSRIGAADVVVRITADCPLIDPEVIDRVVAAFLHGRPDFASNTLQRTWPRGLDTEVMTAAALARAWREAAEPYQRTHVTPYLYQHPESFRLLSVVGQEDLSAERWTVDSAADLEFVRAIYERLGDRAEFGWREVRRLLAAEPALRELNRRVRQKELVEG